MAERQWLVRQALSTALAVCGAVATLFTMLISWHMSDLAHEVKKVPVLEQRIVTLTDSKRGIDDILAKYQEALAHQATNQAVLEQRLISIDQQLKLIATRLSGGRMDGYP